MKLQWDEGKIKKVREMNISNIQSKSTLRTSISVKQWPNGLPIENSHFPDPETSYCQTRKHSYCQCSLRERESSFTGNPYTLCSIHRVRWKNSVSEQDGIALPCESKHRVNEVIP